MSDKQILIRIIEVLSYHRFKFWANHKVRQLKRKGVKCWVERRISLITPTGVKWRWCICKETETPEYTFPQHFPRILVLKKDEEEAET